MQWSICCRELNWLQFIKSLSSRIYGILRGFNLLFVEMIKKLFYKMSFSLIRKQCNCENGNSLKMLVINSISLCLVQTSCDIRVLVLLGWVFDEVIIEPTSGPNGEQDGEYDKAPGIGCHQKTHQHHPVLLSHWQSRLPKQSPWYILFLLFLSLFTLVEMVTILIV